MSAPPLLRVPSSEGGQSVGPFTLVEILVCGCVWCYPFLAREFALCQSSFEEDDQVRPVTLIWLARLCKIYCALRTVFLLTYLLGMRMALERMGVFVVLKDGPTAIFFTICTIVLHLWLTAFLLADARPGLSTRQRLQLQVDDRLRETQWVLTVVIPGIMNAAVYLCFAARCVGLMSGMVWTALLVGLFVVVAAGLYWFARMREQYDMMRRWEVIVLLVTCWLIAAYFPLEGLLRKAVPSLHVLVMRAADLGLMVALRHVVRSWLAAWLDEPRRE